MRIHAFLFAMALSLATPLSAQETSAIDRADDALELIGEARAALSRAESAEDRIAALTRAVVAFEAGLEALRDGLRRVTVRERALVQSFSADSEKLASLLGVLQTLEATPDPVVLVHPDGPLGAARAGMMVAEVVPGLAAQAEEIRLQLVELSQLRETRQQMQESLEAGHNEIQGARLALSQTVAQRVRIPDAREPDPVVLALLAAASTTIEEFAEGLDDIAVTLPESGFSDRKGSLPLPVAARVLRGYGDADQAGVERPGLVLATAAQAVAVSPTAASVRYVGSLLDYGNVIVLEPEAGYLLILAGIKDVYVGSGEILEENAPLGLMGGTQGAPERIGGGQTRRETLYLELRDDGEPVDPALWFVTDEDQIRK